MTRYHWFGTLYLSLVLSLGLVAWGCPTTADDDSADDDDDNDDAADDDAGDDDTLPAEATVSGQADREVATCPPAGDGIGTLCMYLLSDCDDHTSVVASSETPNANMSMPLTAVAFDISEVPDGDFDLYGFLDDDDSGCAGDVTTGDFFIAGGCVDVSVVGQQDVTGVTITFNAKCP